MIIDFNTTVGKGIREFIAPENLLREMDENHVDISIIGPADRCMAVANKEGNNYIAKVTRKYPDRFIGFGCASPWFGQDAVEEVYRIKELGLKGFKIEPFVQGVMLSDHIMDPILKACEENNLPVLVNTGTPVSSMPFQLREVALRFPKVTFIMGHMGFSDFWYDVPYAADGLDNMYLELSYQMPSVIIDAVEKCSADRVLFGSDWPFSRQKIEKDKVYLAGDSTNQRKIMGENAARILGLLEG